MSDQTTAELIAENRKWVRLHQENKYQAEAARRMTHVLDALEAAEQRADLADADLDVELDKNARYREKNDQLAAVIEKVQAVTRAWEVDQRVDPHQRAMNAVQGILASTSAPADALREVKAAVWDEAVKTALNFAVRNLTSGEVFEPANGKWWRTTGNEEPVRRHPATEWEPVVGEGDE